jgi:hypothetical protein
MSAVTTCLGVCIWFSDYYLHVTYSVLASLSLISFYVAFCLTVTYAASELLPHHLQPDILQRVLSLFSPYISLLFRISVSDALRSYAPHVLSGPYASLQSLSLFFLYRHTC